MSNNKPRAEIRNVTPEWAKQVIDKHDVNITDGKFSQRNINDKVVDKYSSDMKAGNWGLTGQGITFDKEGNLLDGQHRLYAVIKSGVTVTMLVLWDVEDKINSIVRTIDLFDVGKKRTLAGQLSIDGVRYYQHKATAARNIIEMCRQSNFSTPMTMTQGISVVGMFGDHMQELIHLLTKDNNLKKATGGVLGTLTLLRCVSKDDADLFATEYNELSNLGKESPVLQFHRFMERPLTARGGSARDNAIRGAMCNALFHYVNEKKVSIVRPSSEHLEWLLKIAKTQVTKVRDLLCETITVKDLEQQ